MGIQTMDDVRAAIAAYDNDHKEDRCPLARRQRELEQHAAEERKGGKDGGRAMTARFLKLGRKTNGPAGFI